MLPVLIAILGLFLTVFLTYFLYYVLILNNGVSISSYINKINAIQETDAPLPKLSIIINAFNEAKIIYRKLENISQLNYPKDSMEIIIVDDFSTDNTMKIAENGLADFKLKGKVIRLSKRLGLNKSLNRAIQEASNPIICVTDSDVILEKDALKRSVQVLEHFDQVGGVTGRIEPVFNQEGNATRVESDYREYYHRSMLSESSIHSAFPGNGPLIIFKKSIVSEIPIHYGSTDANLAAKIIKSGHRLLYIPNAIIYEPVPENYGQQKLQKVRRAKRLIQVFLKNSDIFANRRYGRFGTLIFPLKFSMHVFCPILLSLGIVLAIVFAALSGNVLFQSTFGIGIGALLICLIFSSRIRGLFLSFAFHQVYLLLGLFSSPKRSFTWKIIDRK